MSERRDIELQIATALRKFYAFVYPKGQIGKPFDYVTEFIDEGEYGLALEEMCAHLLVNGRAAPLDVRDEVRRIAEAIGLIESGFIRAVLGGQTKMPPDEELPPI
jgi:hypothetical protein